MTDQTPIATPAIRHDGWSQARIAQFLEHLAADGSVSAACARVGMSREAAYKLRRREPIVARAWNAALVLAREASAEVLECRAIHGIEEEIWYRGELVGTRRKYDSRLLLAHIARLDRIADEERAHLDSARFDELIALAAGEAAPEGLVTDIDGLPLARIDNAAWAGAEARRDLHFAWIGSEEAREAKLAARRLTPEQRADAAIAEQIEHDADCDAEAARASRAAGMIWDRWRAAVCARIDRLLQETVATACTLSTVSTSPAAEPPQA